MLNGQPQVLEMLTFKSTFIEGQRVNWINVHHFDMSAGFGTALCHDTMHSVQLAEAYLHSTGVGQPMVVAYPIGFGHSYGTVGACYVYSFLSSGGYQREGGAELLDYEWCYCLSKNAPYGKSARCFYRLALDTGDVDELSNGRKILRASDDLLSLRERYFDHYMRAGSYQPVIATVDDATGNVTAARPITSYEPHSCVKAACIAEAQERKTMVALQFKEIATNALQDILNLEVKMHQLCTYGLSEIPREEVTGMAQMVLTVWNLSKAVQEYWGVGLQPSVAARWRPTSGLDPYSLQARGCCGLWRGRMEEFISALQDVIDNAGETVPKDAIQAIQPILWQAIVGYAQMMKLERWTGTPLPIHKIL